MTPFAFVFFALILTIANRLYSKYALFKVDGYALALLSNIIGIFLILPFAYPQLPLLFEMPLSLMMLIGLSGVLWTYVAWAGNLSIAQNNFSFKEIIRQTRIIWVVLAGIFILGEKLQLTDLIGVTLIVASVYIISFRDTSFREHISSKPILLAWSVALVAAAITLLEKVILNSTTVLVYAFLAYLLPALFLSLFLNRERLVHVRTLFHAHYMKMLIVSILMASGYYAILSAYQLLPISIAYPMIQSSTAIGVLIGTFLFEENKDWRRKLFAACISVAGVIVIKLF